MSHIVKMLVTDEEVKKAYPVMNQLRTHLTEAQYLELYATMHKQGYHLIGLEVDDTLVAVAGVNILTNFYNLKFLFVYDLVTVESERSKGYGEQLMNFIHEYAKNQGCSHVTLESALHRTEAHRFYEEKMNYSKFCYSFRHTF